MSDSFLISSHNFSGNLVYNNVIFLFAFEVEICTIAVKDGVVSFYHGIAFGKSPAKKTVVIVIQYVQSMPLKIWW